MSHLPALKVISGWIDMVVYVYVYVYVEAIEAMVGNNAATRAEVRARANQDEVIAAEQIHRTRARLTCGEY